ncbi:MAG: hypothetical protein JJT82_06085 [Legionellaceae bacterium]|nr:hypothetical protein [Legionellaceae bacterium]
MEHDFTISLVRTALDALLLRQSVLAHNMANANSADFREIRLDFAEQLRNAHSLSELNQIQLQPQRSDEPVKMDQNLALSVENNLQYRALVKGLNQKLAIMRLAITGQ